MQTHAWFEAAIPGWGWLALDPTNAQQVGQRHITIGHGRDYDDVPPVRGVYAGGGRPSTDASVEIRRHSQVVQQLQAQQRAAPPAPASAIRVSSCSAWRLAAGTASARRGRIHR